MTDRDLVGVVVIGRNEGERLRRCLASIPPGLPTVYVDSASSDGSVALARSRGALVVELDMSLPFSAARARNEGAEALLSSRPETSFIQFVDGDCDIEAGWIETGQAFMAENPGAAVVCGRRRERFPDASFYNALADREWDTPVGEAAACGGDALYRRGAFASVGGFDPSMIAGEEPELCSRLRAAGWRIWRIDAPMTVHDADMHRLRQWWMRAVRCGFGYAQVFARGRVGGSRLYARELARALFWTLGVPLLAVAAAFLLGPGGLLVAPVMWGAQWVLLSLRRGAREGALLLLGKAAETLGAARFALQRLRGRSAGAIFYK